MVSLPPSPSGTTVPSASFRRAPDDDAMFVPHYSDAPALDDYDYVQEEWIAGGEVEGQPYETVVCVRRPRQASRWSGTSLVEPLHVHGIAPIWMYCAPYIMRSGHAWVVVTAQRTTLDMHLKENDPGRYGSLVIPGPDSADFDPNPYPGVPDKAALFWSELERRNWAAGPILAQVGSALREDGGPLEPGSRATLILVGRSQTGSTISYYIRDQHHRLRLADGSAVYDGFFPCGFPFEPFHDVGVPVVQVMSDGDISLPDHSLLPGYEGRHYRRDDSDQPGDRYRLYEIAGLAHVGSRYPPTNDPSMWKMKLPDEGVDLRPRLSTLPDGQLFSTCLDHLVDWLVSGTTPPTAERLRVDTNGYIEKDGHGNSVGGVRCAELDVPRATYLPNPLGPDGRAVYGAVGLEVPFDPSTLRRLYGDVTTYLARYRQRLEELIAQGWFLVEDAEELLSEARRLDFSTGSVEPSAYARDASGGQAVDPTGP